MPDYTSAFSYDDDFNISEAVFDVSNEKEMQSSYDFDELSIDPAFENAAEQLMFVHIGQVLWRERIAKRVDAISQRLESAASAD